MYIVHHQAATLLPGDLTCVPLRRNIKRRVRTGRHGSGTGTHQHRRPST